MTDTQENDVDEYEYYADNYWDKYHDDYPYDD
jgi:hypothetical protein